jgi:hypothetical protein
MYDGRKKSLLFPDSLPEASIYYRYTLVLFPFWGPFSKKIKSPYIFVGLVLLGVELESTNCYFACRTMRNLWTIKSSRGLKAVIRGRREEDPGRRNWGSRIVRPSPPTIKASVKSMGYIT